MSKKHSALQVMILSGALLTSACTGMFRSEPFVDARTDANGAVILLDTPRMWDYWRQDVERSIAAELAGKSPGGGIPTWNEQWVRVIQANRSRENAQRYIDYIAESRRRAGLPELVVAGDAGGP